MQPADFPPLSAPIVTSPKPLSREAAKEHIANYIGHGVKMLTALESQYMKTENKVNTIFEDAKKEIETIKTNLTKKFAEGNDSFSEHEIKDLEKALIEAEKQMVRIIQKSQIKTATAIGTAKADASSKGVSEEGVRSKIETLAKGGIGAKWISFLALVSTTNRVAVKAFEEAKTAMEVASKKDFVKLPVSQVEQDKWAEFQADKKAALERRAGVIGYNGIYRIQVAFDEKTIHKQLKEFSSQKLSGQDREVIEKEFQLPARGRAYIVQSTLIPLNAAFDERFKAGQVFFKNLFGSQGISSTNRREPHLVNGYVTNLTNEGRTIFRGLRHAIASDKYETNKEKRKANSQKAAEELVKAALLLELTDRGLTLEDAVNLKEENRIILNLNSVSLVTPDIPRTVGSKGADERTMLRDQVKAMRRLEKEIRESGVIELDGKKIPVKLNINTFNFGVNAGAVGKFKLHGININLKFLRFGLSKQYKYNQKALQELNTECNAFQGMLEGEKDRSRGTENARARRELRAFDNLVNDINTLMADEHAYLNGDNQYEIGAKILNLTHIMDQKHRELSKKHETSVVGFKGAFNCMSGKDRTGVMDCVAKTFAVMADLNLGQFPTHKELEDGEKRAEFTRIFIPMLLESGSLEVTKTNTGAMGYKVKEEARIFGMDLDKFLQAQGLSVTTAS